MSGRTAFTNDEDNLLVKYIAKYNPSIKGRSGNSLYRTLCDDVDKKWKWSRTHPWQSWRDRYCKNQQEFDIKIKRYQNKHNLLPANENMGEESSEERQVGLSKRKRGKEEEEKRARIKHHPTSSQITASATEEPTVLDKGKRKAVANGAEDDPTLEDQEESAALNITPVDVVNQNAANEDEVRLRLPARTTPTSSPSLHPDAKGSLSTTIQSNSQNPSQKTSITERQRKSSITYQTSHRTILADPQPMASSSKVQISPPKSNVPTQAQAIQNSRRRKPVVRDDPFFGSPPPTPSPLSGSNAVRPKHRKPKLVEGPFGIRFARKGEGNGNGSSEDEQGTPVWPPVRRGNNFKGKGKVVEPMTTNTVTRTLPRDDENAFGRKTHPVGEHQPRRTSSSSMNGLDNGQEEVDNPSTSLQGRIQHPVHRESFHEVNETPDPPRPSQVSSGPHNSLNSVPAAKAESSDTGGEREPKKPLPPRHSWTPNNPFRSTDEAITRRHSMGNLREVQSSAVRRLDLRAEMAKRRLAASSPFANSRGHSVISTMSYQPSPEFSHGHANPSQRRRSSIPIADEDREHIEFLGLNAAIESIAQESGYSVEQVWRVYDHYRSIKRAEEWIRLYRKNSARVQELTHEQMMKNGMGALAIADDQRTPRSSPLEHSQKPHEPSTEATMSTRHFSPKTQENRLKIRPLPPDLQRSHSEYSPPQETRAGEYNRLVGQGRVEEAMLREHRRVSGSGGVFPRLRSSPAIWETPHQSSPSNGAETVEDEEIKDEDDAADQLLNGSQSQADLQEEEEELFLSAHAGMIETLRTIEQNMNPDYMLRWVAARLGEMRDGFRSPSPS